MQSFLSDFSSLLDEKVEILLVTNGLNFCKFLICRIIREQVGAEISFPSFFGLVPWRHHVEIVSGCNSVEEALFYLQGPIEEGWSWNASIDCIKAELYHNTGMANINFAKNSPEYREG